MEVSGKMTINILVNHVFDGWSPLDTRLGGTEESVVKWAEILANKGHVVTVYQNGFEDEHNKVIYKDRFGYNGGGDICINVKTSEVAPKEPTLYLTNETNATEKDLSMYDGVIWPSQWAADNIPVNNSTVHILPHGYDSSEIYPGKKIPKQCLYASSPDRGLDILLKAWPSVYKAHPDASLIVTYGAPAGEYPGVIFLGEVDEDTMNELYRTSQYWVHPCTGGELFGITGIKAQAAECWPVIIPTMALAETVKYGTFSDFKHYAEDLTNALTYEPIIVKKHTYPDWNDTAEMLLNIIQATLNKSNVADADS